MVSLRSYGTPTYCDVPPIEINNKSKNKVSFYIIVYRENLYLTA